MKVYTCHEPMWSSSHVGISVVLWFCSKVAPEFLIPLADVTCAFGETVVLCCKVCGRPKPKITLKGPDQSPIVNNSRFTINIRYLHVLGLNNWWLCPGAKSKWLLACTPTVQEQSNILLMWLLISHLKSHWRLGYGNFRYSVRFGWPNASFLSWNVLNTD